MSQINILKRAMIVVALAGVAMTILASQSAPASVTKGGKDVPAAIEMFRGPLDVVVTPNPKAPSMSLVKSTLRIPAFQLDPPVEAERPSSDRTASAQ